MLTGDNEAVAKETARALGIAEYRASLKPEDKLREMEKLLPYGPIGMVGDGINDAPALSRADVGVAMGGGGTAVAVEAADIVILNDDISKLPDMIDLGRRTRRVVKTDIIIWALSNAVGFYLVFTGIAGLAFAAFYNFATDFLPLGNSVMFFRGVKKKIKDL
jgi:Cd2+/Zn2+-exporting ATPase